MTAFTINGGGVTNWETLTGGSVNATLDSYAISNGTTLLINTDGHLCTNHSLAFGSLDTVTYSGIGGEILFNTSQIRVMAFTSGAGNVPAIGAVISQGGVTGYFLGVWSGWQVENTASGAAMPATGFIKFKNKVGGSFVPGALTGIAATASEADRVGWGELRGADTASITVPRVGKFRVLGDWFDLGLTTGVRGQILACPTTGTVAGVFPAIWVETAAGSGIYERYTSVGSMVNLATAPTDERGKMFWQTTAGIRIGSDGTNNVGFLPPSGCKVRIPNAILTCCTRTAVGSGPRVLPNAALATRQEFITTSAGDIDFNGAVCQWYANFTQPFRTKIYNSAISGTLVISEQSAPLDIDNVTIAPTQAQLSFALNLVSNFGGGNVKNTRATRFSLATSGTYVNAVNFNKGVIFDNVTTKTQLNRGNANTGTWSCTQNQDCQWKNCKNIGGRMVLVGDVNGLIENMAYADAFSGTTTSANAHYAIDRSLGCLNTVIKGFSSLVTNSHPYNGIVTTANSYDLEIREIGTFAAPYNMGTVNAMGLIVKGAGNNDGIRMKRIYTVNSRIGPWAFLNSDTDIVAENVAGDYADTSVMAGLNATIKGCALAAATAGQVSVYGTHWWDRFTEATAGMIEISCNEPTTDSAAQCAVTGGTPRFNSSGSVLLTSVGDQVTWTTPYFIKGHTAFANLAATLTGTNTGNIIYQYQIDIGSGFGAVKTLSGANLSGETISPASGFRLEIIATCATASAGNVLTNIRLTTVTTSVAQSTNLYPLATVTVTFTGIITGSDLVVLQAGTNTIRQQADEIVGTSYPYTYETLENIDIGIFKEGYVPQYIRNYPLGSTNTSIPVTQVADRNFA